MKKKYIFFFLITFSSCLLWAQPEMAAAGVAMEWHVAEGDVADVLPKGVLKLAGGEVFYPEQSLLKDLHLPTVGQHVSLRYYIRREKKIYVELAVGRNSLRQQEQRRERTPEAVY